MKGKIIEIAKTLSLEETALSIIEFNEQNLSDYRKSHILQVSYFSYHLAVRENQENDDLHKKSFLAAMLHDCTKERKPQFHYDLFKKHGVEEKYSGFPVPVLHSKSAGLFAQDQFSIRDPEIDEAISCHTTGKIDMSNLAQILYAGDYLGSLEFEAAQSSFNENDLSSLCLEKVKKSMTHLVKANHTIHPDTFEYYNSLAGKS